MVNRDGTLDALSPLSRGPVVPPSAPPPSAQLAGAAPRTAPASDPGPAGDAALALARELAVTITMADVLHRAGRRADDGTRRWLEPLLAHLTPPDAMADRAAAAARLARAVRARERIAVFGDYDCDGITSTAIVTGALRSMGGDVTPLLATRREGSYGFSAPALGRVRGTGATLLVTCDCGSSDHERLAAARAAGIDVVVIDHHLVPTEPLPVVAFLNPHRPECGFPDKHLASCGLALSLAAAVRKELGATLDLRRWLDLVAIGTIADVAPLSGDNRPLVRAGLTVLASGARPGLRALAAHARFDLGQGVRGDDIAFRIAPRLNAPGRLADPDLALELLLCRDEAAAWPVAADIEQIAARRREIQERMVAEAIADVETAGWAASPALVLAREGWHPGVVGIVAGRIATRYGLPTVVVALEGPTGRGSVRGPAGARLHDALGRCRDTLVGFGGHQAAAGVEVRAERVAAFRDAWCAAFAGAGLGVVGPPAADVRLDERDDPSAVVADLDRLEPCGEGNRAPRVLVADASVLRVRDIKGHLKLDVTVGGRTVDAFGFELGVHAPTLGAGDRVDLVGHLRRDTWRGGDAVTVRVEQVTRR